MIEALAPKAPDPLLKIIKMYREDPRGEKIDLGVGVYRDETGETPVMKAVKEAERRLWETQKTKTYVGQQGDVEFLRLLGELSFGPMAREFVSIQAVGGTGALRLGCDLLRESGARRVLLPAPSWPNHPAIIAAARLERVDVPFFDVAEQRIDLDGLIAGFARAERGDAVILQACCHNPLGADFTLPQWLRLAEEIAARGLIPFLDLAYQGFGDGIEEDVAGARALLERVPEAIVAVSGAKTFGVYRERVGALYVKAPEKARHAVMSNLAAIARANYSMPPDHGAAIVREVLGDAELRAVLARRTRPDPRPHQAHARGAGCGAHQLDPDAPDRRAEGHVLDVAAFARADHRAARDARRLHDRRWPRQCRRPASQRVRPLHQCAEGGGIGSRYASPFDKLRVTRTGSTLLLSVSLSLSKAVVRLAARQRSWSAGRRPQPSRPRGW
jgi:aromatic-amino-acid transaminase